jgi:hypothetical protein
MNQEKIRCAAAATDVVLEGHGAALLLPVRKR